MAKNETAEAVKDNDKINQARTAMANLILKTIEELDNKRVSNPEQMYNALANMYTAIK